MLVRFLVVPSNFPDLSDVTLVVAEDDADSLEVLVTFLTACGAKVLQASTAIGALAYVDSVPHVDAIITDLSMPRMDGLELIRRVRSHPNPARKTLPAIALTGFYEKYADTAGTGFDAFLKKPVDIDGLCVTVRHVVDARRRLAALST